MEKFTTLITENYELEQKLKKYILSKTDDPKSIEINCTPDYVKIKFAQNFGNGLMRINDILQDISKIVNEYPFISKTRIDNHIFDITLTKKKKK